MREDPLSISQVDVVNLMSQTWIICLLVLVRMAVIKIILLQNV